MTDNSLKTERLNNFLWIFAIVLFCFGLIFFATTIYKFSSFYQISDGKKINIEDTAQIGDFIGGILGPIWSLTGVVLFYLALRYQREDLELQRTELKDTRKEFESNRITNIIFKQNENIEIELNKVKVSFYGPFTTFDTLANILTEIKKYNPDVDGDNVLLYYTFQSDIVSRNMERLEKASQHLLDLIAEIEKGVLSVKSAFLYSSVNKEDLRPLKSLFFRNIGRKRFLILRNIYNTFKLDDEIRSQSIDNLPLTNVDFIIVKKSIYEFFEFYYDSDFTFINIRKIDTEGAKDDFDWLNER